MHSATTGLIVASSTEVAVPPANVDASLTEKSDRDDWIELRRELDENKEAAAVYMSALREINERQLWRFDYRDQEQFMISERQRLSSINISRQRKFAEVKDVVGGLLAGVAVRESHLRRFHELGLQPGEMMQAAEEALKAANHEGKRVSAIHFEEAAEAVAEVRQTKGLITDVASGRQVPATNGVTALSANVIHRVNQRRQADKESQRAAMFVAEVRIINRRKRLAVLAFDGSQVVAELDPKKKYRIIAYEVME